MEPPVISKTIPTQVTNELGAYGPFDLKTYITGEGLQFQAELTNGNALPQGLICTGDGILTGIPAKETAGNYEIVVTATNEAGAVKANVMLSIKPSLATTGSGQEFFDQLKIQVWEALEHNLPVPEFKEMMSREVTPLDVYYLLERWGILVIWDAFNIEPPSTKISLNLAGASEHYHVYDRGSCLITNPKDLFSHERTLEDGLMTARAMAREVYQRNWSIEMAGFNKLVRAAWVEVQHLGDQYGKRLNVVNYRPTPDEVKLYTKEAVTRFKSGME